MCKVKILVVDDNEQFLGLLNEYLVTQGYDVNCSYNGVEAIDTFKEVKPDIVVTDIVMPEIDGIELLLSLRKINPDIQIIAMSGGNLGHAKMYLKMAENLGANSILSKPFQLSELLIEVKKLTDSTQHVSS